MDPAPEPNPETPRPKPRIRLSHAISRRKTCHYVTTETGALMYVARTADELFWWLWEEGHHQVVLDLQNQRLTLTLARDEPTV